MAAIPLADMTTHKHLVTRVPAVVIPESKVVNFLLALPAGNLDLVATGSSGLVRHEALFILSSLEANIGTLMTATREQHDPLGTRSTFNSLVRLAADSLDQMTAGPFLENFIAAPVVRHPHGLEATEGTRVATIWDQPDLLDARSTFNSLEWLTADCQDGMTAGPCLHNFNRTLVPRHSLEASEGTPMVATKVRWNLLRAGDEVNNLRGLTTGCHDGMTASSLLHHHLLAFRELLSGLEVVADLFSRVLTWEMEFQLN
jgi:hypothetical protein